MKQLTLFAVAGLLIAGCGGSGGGTTAASLFSGGWDGTWNSPATGDSGTADVTVSGTGRVTGVSTRSGGPAGTISGSISNSGDFSGQAVYPGEPVINISGTFTSNSARTSLSGNLIQRVGSNEFPLSFTLTKR